MTSSPPISFVRVPSGPKLTANVLASAAAAQLYPFAFAPNRSRAAVGVTVGEGIAPSASASKPCVPVTRHTAPQ